MIREAFLYSRNEDQSVQCSLCAHRCVIAPERFGICGVRGNRDGTLYSMVYGTLIAEHVDPIEKKPFFHVLPGSRSYSVATVGCNFRCAFCQNASISQSPQKTRMIPGEDVSPGAIVDQAIRAGCQSVAYTYTEPTVYFETAYETAAIAHDRGLLNLFITNGFMTSEALKMIEPYLDAANVDLKSFRDEFYKKYCGGRLNPVLETLRCMKTLGIWVEITTLLIPGLNDSEDELRDIAAFIAGLGKEIPWHISRFHPQYKMPDRPATPVSSLHRAMEIGHEAGLHYVYSGNVPGDKGENTLCSNCKTVLIERYGYQIRAVRLDAGRCNVCQAPFDGIVELNPQSTFDKRSKQ